MAPNPSAADDERAVSLLDHPWLRLDGCVYARVSRIFPDLGLTCRYHVDVVADNVYLYDLGESAHGGHKPMVFEVPRWSLCVVPIQLHSPCAASHHSNDGAVRCAVLPPHRWLESNAKAHEVRSK